ncbi:hypothetical protein [Deinococcus daejeonensis]|uniref:Uncharacterized protein n=1 Tax=Deinococcus daejeonensis TaxID=1007098 RepID=A0ABQ2JJW7_9DEIO|nr:hypothetical protein [Deinococcus daejeonensis]GGN47037.1 hypothetical protein GCM10010842_38180 [Deinococcus daejeonensis]
MFGRDGQPLTRGNAPDAAAVIASLARPGTGPRDLTGGTLVPVTLRGA